MSTQPKRQPSIAIIIPTCNAGSSFAGLLSEIARQTIQPACKLVVDSASTDKTVELAIQAGWNVLSIAREKFSHGGTRQQAVDTVLTRHPSIEILVFLTQDVRMPQMGALEELVMALEQKDIGAAYGRQLPHDDASIYAAVEREFNYPPQSRVKSVDSAAELGIKTAFLSDSFAAYRVSALKKIGGFPVVDICEDMYVAGRMLLAGYRIAYAAEAAVKHSHEPSLHAIWHRYRAMGKFQQANPWLRENFGRADGEGLRLLRHQLARVGGAKGVVGIAKIIVLDAVRLLAFKLA